MENDVRGNRLCLVAGAVSEITAMRQPKQSRRLGRFSDAGTWGILKPPGSCPNSRSHTLPPDLFVTRGCLSTPAARPLPLSLFLTPPLALSFFLCCLASDLPLSTLVNVFFPPDI